VVNFWAFAFLSPAADPASAGSVSSPHRSPRFAARAAFGHPAVVTDSSRTLVNRYGRNARLDMAPIQGTIKRLVTDKGFGFVQAADGTEYFFHQSACVDARFDELREGQALTFEKGQGPKGPRAENIRLA
jgi:CspA family cold shock protein